jgi:gamma-glutamylcyclotransferase (GGCT)/AIG2-like uncharacterized protein YtfP
VTRRPSTALFTYGTLQLPEVQMEKYGRLLSGEPDDLPCFRVTHIDVYDTDVVRLSGKSRHPIAIRTDDLADAIHGVVYWLTEAELHVTDDYEVAPYARVEAELKSGRKAFAYVRAG